MYGWPHRPNSAYVSPLLGYIGQFIYVQQVLSRLLAGDICLRPQLGARHFSVHSPHAHLDRPELNMPTTIDISDAARPLALAIDIGTSSARALLYDATGRAVQDRHAQFAYEIETGIDGRSTFDASELREIAEAVI